MTAYAAVADMVSRFGESEIIRFSAGDGPLPDAIEPARIDQALADASALIDSYLRRRYAAPLTAPPPDIVRAACTLARYDLAMGGDREPSEQMRLARKEVVDWLMALAEGKATLEGVTPIGASSSARVSDRERTFSGGDGLMG